MGGGEHADGLRELILCSLEPWNDVWRRNQFLVDQLLKRNPNLRVLFVEPADSWRGSLRRNPDALPVERPCCDRLTVFRPIRRLPQRVPGAETFLGRQVLRAARGLGFVDPILWVNDSAYASLARDVSWRSLYDVTDDWLLAPFAQRELSRLRRRDSTLMKHANAVVVCSEALARSRGQQREVTLIPNAVDVDHFRRPRPKPSDLPPSPAAVYVGSLHEARIDLKLVEDIASSIPELSVALVGPVALTHAERSKLAKHAQVRLLGPRPYAHVPAYLQHADLILVPHRVTPFTESLDPIKAYECLAVGTPTVATPVAGFRELGPPVVTAPRESFVSAVRSTLGTAKQRFAPVPTWAERASAIETILRGLAADAAD